MKIEKVNDHQIRCTLTKDDLANRQIKISELAYGSDKAKDLFRDMMQQASFQFGFEAEDIPLMIEAIPLNAECIVLIITKVEDPEELDTRFSKFAPSVHDEEDEDGDSDNTARLSGAADVLDLFRKMGSTDFDDSEDDDMEDTITTPSSARQNMLSVATPANGLNRMYSFKSIYDMTRFAHTVSGLYNSKNSLYKTPAGKFLLVITKGKHTPVEYNKICNILSEYATAEKYTAATDAYLAEHCEKIIAEHAVQSLELV